MLEGLEKQKEKKKQISNSTHKLKQTLVSESWVPSGRGYQELIVQKVYVVAAGMTVAVKSSEPQAST